MKILFLATEFPTQSPGGLQTVFVNLIRHLQTNHQCQVHRVNISRDDKLAIRLFDHLTAPMLTMTLRSFPTVYKVMRKTSFDFIICGHIYFAFIGYLIKLLRKTPYIILAHGLEITRPRLFLTGWKKAIYRKALQEADRIIAPTSYTKGEVAKWNIDIKRVEIIPWGIDIKHFSDVNEIERWRNKLELNGKKMILTVGRLVERKGQDKVIDALPMIVAKYPDVVYFIVGKGPLKDALQRRVMEQKMERYVRFYDNVEDKILPIFYHLCQVFTMPSRVIDGWDAEGFGLAFLEAGACGKSVIAGRSGGIVDIVRDGITGFLVDPNDEKEIANKTLYLLQEEELAQKMGEEGRKDVLKNYTWDNFITKFEKSTNEYFIYKQC